MLDKQYWIDQLGLLPHPEGGYYKELPDSKDWFEEKKRIDRFIRISIFY